MGESLEDVAKGIDCEAVRQPLGVFACIAPFNFPAMVPLWFYPFAVACGKVVYRGRKVHVDPFDENALRPSWLRTG